MWLMLWEDLKVGLNERLTEECECPSFLLSHPLLFLGVMFVYSEDCSNKPQVTMFFLCVTVLFLRGGIRISWLCLTVEVEHDDCVISRKHFKHYLNKCVE